MRPSYPYFRATSARVRNRLQPFAFASIFTRSRVQTRTGSALTATYPDSYGLGPIVIRIRPRMEKDLAQGPLPCRHGRACPGHPPPTVEAQMAGTTAPP